MADTNKGGAASFKDTLNLPRTDFPIRPNAKVDDPAMIERWNREDLFGKSFYQNLGNPRFILHDGPPYANGNIHIGHAYNKTLKDFVTKSQRMFGKQVPVTPGWDCHGLPIEFKVNQEHPGLSREQLKRACRAYAQKWIEIQREEFKSLGVLMDWNRYYSTMSFEYEAAILRAFGSFVNQGYIERKNKTVPWCPFDRTVLAQAEIEYQERKDPSIYVMFTLETNAASALFPSLKGEAIQLLIWTTTPWTLPLNRAVLVKPNTEYVILKAKGQLVIVGASLADQVAAKLEIEKDVVATFNSDELVKLGAQAHHPFVPGLVVPVIADDSVLLGEGTACVHSAPGAGPEDYEVGVKNNLEIYSPVGPDGTYGQTIEPKELVGMHVDDGQIWVLKKLTELNKLLWKGSIRHSYPHCWRCHKGLIFRATKQWFLDLSKNDLKERTLELADSIATVPETGINRLKSTLEGRLEWCISRQRAWGVPIPALICVKCDHTYITQEFVDKAAAGVLQEGIEFWDRVRVADLLPKNFSCPDCKGTQFEKEFDILDVWFESGVSHYAVLRGNDELGYPADMYLEGKDQHRAWFQSSLLTSIALEGTPCMKTIVTHGFTVDEKGHKMSKSLGNVVSPAQMIEKLGTDGLRLWAATTDLAGDAVVSETFMRNVQEVFRKIRNTSRFLLSNLYDFDIDDDAVPMQEMLLVDQYAMQELYKVNNQVQAWYTQYDFTAVSHALSNYCASELSAYYLDIIKDRLYVEQADGRARRSAQTACWYILDTLTKLMAPILSITAEQISDMYQKNKTESIHLQQFAQLHEAQTAQESRWAMLKEIRNAILKALEAKREQGEIKHSLDARVTLHAAGAVKDVLNGLFVGEEARVGELISFLKEYLIVSQVEIEQTHAGLHETALPDLWVHAEKARGEKCPRCWNWCEKYSEDHLCTRCQAVIETIK